MKKYNVAVVGATGLVGRTILKVLEERKFPIAQIYLFSSSRSAGRKINFSGNEIIIQELNNNSFEGVDLAFFSAGSQVSNVYAPIANNSGCIVIDNSSCWRMSPEVPLVVPEVNASVLLTHKYIIANPNCSTIQLTIPLKALHEKFKLKRVVVSTYQAISGAGQKGIDKLYSEINNKLSLSSNLPNPDIDRNSTNNTINNFSSHDIFNNIMFHELSSSDKSSNITVEEEKMLNETRKILSIDDLKISVTCVRVPIENSHSMSVNVELELPATVEDVRRVLSDYENIIIVDDMNNNIYPTPQLSNGRDEVFIGRIRADHSANNAFNLWVVADNLRKGAATNAIQIAEKLIEKELL